MDLTTTVKERVDAFARQRRWRTPDLTDATPYYRHYAPSVTAGRALVLGGGGATGIGWMAGLIVGLADRGLDLGLADTVIGTSAGSVVGAHLRVGMPMAHSVRRLASGEVAVPPGRVHPADALRFVVAQSVPGSPSRGRALIGRAALRAQTAPEEDWVTAVGDELIGEPWPDARLVITAVDAETGESVAFDRHAGVPLHLAMAASCAVPKVYPAVEINGHRYVDGGVRTTTNADLAKGHDRVVVIAPIPYAVHRRDRPRELLATLGPDVRSCVVAPDADSRRAIGRDVLDVSRVRDAARAGHAQAEAVRDVVRDVWE